MPTSLERLLEKRKSPLKTRMSTGAKPRREAQTEKYHEPAILRFWDQLARTKPGSEEAAKVLEAWRA